MTKWKNVLLSLALVLPLAAIGGSQSLTTDALAMNGFDGLVEPPACGQELLAGSSTSWDCRCAFFHLGMWYCYPCP